MIHVNLVGTPEDAHETLHEIVVPTAKAQPGFLSGTWMQDGTGNGMGPVLLASAEDAEAAKRVLTPNRWP